MLNKLLSQSVKNPIKNLSFLNLDFYNQKPIPKFTSNILASRLALVTKELNITSFEITMHDFIKLIHAGAHLSKVGLISCTIIKSKTTRLKWSRTHKFSITHIKISNNKGQLCPNSLEEIIVAFSMNESLRTGLKEFNFGANYLKQMVDRIMVKELLAKYKFSDKIYISCPVNYTFK